MEKRNLLPFLLAGAVAASGVSAGAQESHSGHAAESPYPEVCRSDAALPPAAHSDADMAALSDHQKAAMEGMMRMDRDMSQGMMKDDADVAFVCGMIAHHQGAIDMANVELQFGDDEWAKELARQVIEAQTREIADMTEWLNTNAR